ncbi:helix-turn-helix domain-containing protein [Cytobacillus purgationiresistens]|uniref:Cytoskeletal protein RodZ n=1 Tax=Cytobacillus purgationiresistens TaxID=863449 RepID=A0ABU0AH04_9BACI|nr:cytoskeletal protein RodZ [Cytobacillus purgationiresistens]
MTELGNRLKEARLAKGMSLDDLQTATKIQKRYLVGIEEGNYSMMPGKFYVRAFIKQYAEAVGINHEELLEEFKSDIPSSMNDDIPEKLSRVQTRRDISGKASKFFDILPKILIVVFIIGVIAVIYYFVEKGASNNSKVPAEQKDTPGAIVENNLPDDDAKDGSDGEKNDENTEDEANDGTDAPDENAEDSKQEIKSVETSGKNSVYELTNSDTFELKLVSTGETWVSIKNGKGYSFFQGMLIKDGTDSETVDLSNESEALLVIGNSSATEIYINDEKIDYAVSPTNHVSQNITIRYVPTDE